MSTAEHRPRLELPYIIFIQKTNVALQPVAEKLQSQRGVLIMQLFPHQARARETN